MSGRYARQGLLLAAFIGVVGAGPAGAAEGWRERATRVTVRPVAVATCDRREVGRCQDTARSEGIRCVGAPGPLLDCMDTVLARQSACWVATGCR